MVAQHVCNGVIRVLVIEDNRADVRLIRLALGDAGMPCDLHVIENGADAISLVHRIAQEQSAPQPHVVLLDLNLPQGDGIDVLRAMRQSQKLRDVPIAVLTSSGLPSDRSTVLGLGATCFIRKPSRVDQIADVAQTVRELWRSVS